MTLEGEKNSNHNSDNIVSIYFKKKKERKKPSGSQKGKQRNRHAHMLKW